MCAGQQRAVSDPGLGLFIPARPALWAGLWHPRPGAGADSGQHKGPGCSGGRRELGESQTVGPWQAGLPLLPEPQSAPLHVGHGEHHLSGPTPCPSHTWRNSPSSRSRQAEACFPLKDAWEDSRPDLQKRRRGTERLSHWPEGAEVGCVSQLASVLGQSRPQSTELPTLLEFPG